MSLLCDFVLIFVRLSLSLPLSAAVLPRLAGKSAYVELLAQLKT